MKIINLVAASVLLATASVAMADSTGFYAGVLAGYGKVNYKGVEKNHGIDAGVNVGYMINNNFGVEVGFMQYSKVKVAAGENIVNNYSIHVAGVAKYDLTDAFNVFGKLGLADVSRKFSVDGLGSDTESRSALFAAAGVGYNVTQNIEVSFEGDVTTKNDEIPAMYSANVGVAYKF